VKTEIIKTRFLAQENYPSISSCWTNILEIFGYTVYIYNLLLYLKQLCIYSTVSVATPFQKHRSIVSAVCCTVMDLSTAGFLFHFSGQTEGEL
jgi:hypothetical protein